MSILCPWVSSPTARLLGAIVLAGLLSASVASAGGTISDGSVSYTFVGHGPLGAENDFVVGGADHLFQTWWWYRVAGDTEETVLPAPDSESYVGNVATFDWADVDGRGLFSAQLITTVIEGMPPPPPVSANLVTELTITNLSTMSSLTIDIFSYTDLMLGGDFNNDESATLTADPDYIGLTDGTTTDTAEYRGPGADEYQVTAAFTLRGLLLNSAVNDLDGTGLPFGPGDFTGAFQWADVVLGPAPVTPPPAGTRCPCSMPFKAVLAVNEPAVPVTLTSFMIE